ncbi:MAG: macro domain-containing protein [Erysipelotrichaceae bacterium]
MPFHIIRNDITKLKVDAIVNSTNPQLLEGSGVSEAIFQAAGRVQLQQALAAYPHANISDVIVTPGFALPCSLILHAVTPAFLDGTHNESALLVKTYQNILASASAQGLTSIAFPLLSSGNYRFPKDLAIDIAKHTIQQYLANHELVVYLVVYDKASFQLSKQRFDDVVSYIEEHQIQTFGMRTSALEMPCRIEACESLEERLANKETTFSDHLLNLIMEANRSDVEVYKQANIDRKLFSKIRSNQNYIPSKKTALAFAFALHLSLDDSLDLLKRAGYTLSQSNEFDLICQYCFEHKIYDLYEINQILFSMIETTLSNV